MSEHCDRNSKLPAHIARGFQSKRSCLLGSPRAHATKKENINTKVTDCTFLLVHAWPSRARMAALRKKLEEDSDEQASTAEPLEDEEMSTPESAAEAG